MFKGQTLEATIWIEEEEKAELLTRES